MTAPHSYNSDRFKHNNHDTDKKLSPSLLTAMKGSTL
uniref:Uncharacterized protein n=1 Tax=Anguilla anguilla TaxID=7936 RepID=A0A0E9W2U6_ANGAN